ncbi:uncharacterized protein LOC108666828 isoform X2 [Hyalella azteca]|uniref:Innexin n=1 Tax=Hyalella azteca TaxID=294128 RepID=A0A8B7N5T8_HYAAZ|nr:uncharacterized protein LOC108666828 isoform X1 [Hyalella azteca]XP_047736899.1 uncharacterized protein LOC108666828 isoform X2 [Hyalella azteca]
MAWPLSSPVNASIIQHNMSDILNCNKSYVNNGSEKVNLEKSCQTDNSLQVSNLKSSCTSYGGSNCDLYFECQSIAETEEKLSEIAFHPIFFSAVEKACCKKVPEEILLDTKETQTTANVLQVQTSSTHSLPYSNPCTIQCGSDSLNVESDHHISPLETVDEDVVQIHLDPAIYTSDNPKPVLANESLMTANAPVPVPRKRKLQDCTLNTAMDCVTTLEPLAQAAADSNHTDKGCVTILSTDTNNTLLLGESVKKLEIEPSKSTTEDGSKGSKNDQNSPCSGESLDTVCLVTAVQPVPPLPVSLKFSHDSLEKKSTRSWNNVCQGNSRGKRGKNRNNRGQRRGGLSVTFSNNKSSSEMGKNFSKCQNNNEDENIPEFGAALTYSEEGHEIEEGNSNEAGPSTCDQSTDHDDSNDAHLSDQSNADDDINEGGFFNKNDDNNSKNLCASNQDKGGNNNKNNNNNKGSNNTKWNPNHNNNNNNKGGGGDLKWDAFYQQAKHLCYSIGLLKRSNGPGYTLESLCLQFHYRFLVFFFGICYFIVMLNWFVNEKIVCYELQWPDKPHIPKGHSSNVCLSYPYVEVENKHRRYLLFYRWVPYSFLLVAALFYTLRAGLVKKWEDTRLAALYKDVWNERCKYVIGGWENTNHLVVQYLQTGQSVSSHYVRWILCHVFANLVDLVAVLVFQFVLQGEFVLLVPNVLHGLERNPANFTDKLSIIFPPFTKCQISAAHKIIVNGIEINFGCHLTLMELYEKIFIITWFVLALHWLWSFAMVIWLSIGMVPFFGKFSCVVTGRLINRKSAAIMVKAVRVCSMGDVHVLCLVKKWMSNAQFEQLLKAVVNSKEEELRKNGYKKSQSASLHKYCSGFTAVDMDEPRCKAN